MDVIYIDEYLNDKIKRARHEMDLLMAAAVVLIDEAAETKYDFEKIGRARRMIDKAVELHKTIKQLESSRVA